MTAVPALLLAAAIATMTGNTDLKAYAACRNKVQVISNEGCTWRSGSLSAGMGQYSTRIAFRHGRPGAVAIDQPGGSRTEFIPVQGQAIQLHMADMSAIDGEYLICALGKRPDPYAPNRKLNVACLAGAKHLRAGSIAWTFPDAPTMQHRPHR